MFIFALILQQYIFARLFCFILVAPVPGGIQTPVPSLPPNMDDVIVELTPYYLFYDIVQSRIPNLDDFSELGLFTSEYLRMYFRVIFADNPEIDFVTSMTEVIGSEFRLGQPTRVDYLTSVSFAASSETVPGLADLDILLRGAFEGENAEMYTTAIANGLDEDNIFSTTSSVTFELAPSGSGTERRAAVAVGSAAAAFFVLLVGIVAYRNREHEEDQEKLLKGNETVAEERTLETQERTHRSEEEDEDGDNGNASRYGYTFGPPLHRPHTVPPVFMLEEDESGRSVGAVAERKETVAERRKRLENVAL